MKPLPPRYYAELINNTIFESVIEAHGPLESSESRNHIWHQLVYLLDIVAITTVLHSIPTKGERIAFLNAYSKNFQSPDLLTTLHNIDIGTIQELLSEKLDRALLALA